VHKAYIKYANITYFDKFNIPYADIVMEIQQSKRDKADKEEIDTKDQADRAGHPGSVMISDAFFLFRDGVDVVSEKGYQPFSGLAAPCVITKRSRSATKQTPGCYDVYGTALKNKQYN